MVMEVITKAIIIMSLF